MTRYSDPSAVKFAYNNPRPFFALSQELGWVVNLVKSELIHQQVFNFVGYFFDPSQGLVKPTHKRWQTLTQKIQTFMG